MENIVPRTPEQSLTDELRELINKRNLLTERTKCKVIFELQKEKLESESRRLHFQEETLKEIIRSEERYLYQLHLILEYFTKPLCHVIKQSTAAGLFENINILYNLNSELLDNLKRDCSTVNVSNAFLKIAPFLKLYTSYANDYKKVIFAIQELRRHDQRLNENLTIQETRPEVAIRLNSLLIVPIQRVPRYVLLLKELLEHSSPSTVEYIKISEALHEVQSVTNYINNQVSQHDNLLRLIQLQLSLPGGKPNIILPGRNLIKEGVLMKVSKNGTRKGKPRHFVLMTDSLLCCKIKSAVMQSGYLLPLRKTVVEHVLGRGVFKLTTPAHEFLLYSEDSNAANDWVEAIKSAIMQYEERKKTLRKKSCSRQALLINQCLTLDDLNDSMYKKRKLTKTDAEDRSQCFPAIKRRFFEPECNISDNNDNNSALVKSDCNKENNDSNGLFASFTKMFIKLKSYWF